ncbi:MAG TPA: pyridoxal-phosphate dependent enzyme [Bacteroidia bacterium]|nr:pyridoxal-phosphate dependent enzyme [Bacteroidia bacterium]
MTDPDKSKKFMLLTDPVLEKYGVKIFVMREDLTHPVAGGNKFRKLKYNLERAKSENKTTLVTFGGAWSNHIAATAFAGKENGFKTIGIIRGEKTEPLNLTLKRASGCEMKLIYMDRASYRDKEAALEVALRNHDKAEYYVIPEGGSNYEGYRGCVEITSEIDFDFNYICTPCGTGTTLAGIASSLNGNQKAIGFSVLKNNPGTMKNVADFLKQDNLQASILNLQYFNDYHFGGYAKSTSELDHFVKRFVEINKIAIEPVYTGKMFFGIYDLVKKGFFKKGDVVIAVHTGGLQYFTP